MSVIDPYGRVSRASDKNEMSTPGQLSECKDIILERGHQIGVEHVDKGKSAWDPKRFRPGWNALMNRLDRREADGVCVFELSRFARRQEDGLRLLRLAQEGVIVIDSEGEYDLTKPKQAKNFSDAIVAAEYESAMIGVRTRRGKKHKAIRGEHNSSTRAFGFEPGGLLPREPEAAILREMARRLIDGEDQSVLCRELTERGIYSSLGNIWKAPALRVALLRPGNVGDVAFNGEIMARDAHPGILDRDVYEQVVGLYARRRRGRPVTNLCSRFVVCAKCGRGLNGKELIGCTPYPDGAPMRAYLCVKRDGGCGQHIDWVDLNDFVRDFALDTLSDPAHARAVEASVRAADDKLKPVTEKITALEAMVKDLAARRYSGDMEEFEWEAARQPLKDQLTKLRAHEAILIRSAPQRRAAGVGRSRSEWERRWQRGDLTERREIIASALRGRRLAVSPGPRLQPARERVALAGVQAAGQGGGGGDVGLAEGP